MRIVINDLVFEETDEWGDNTVCGNHYQYNGIELDSVHDFDPIGLKFYVWSLPKIKNKLGDDNFVKIKPHLIVNQI